MYVKQPSSPIRRIPRRSSLGPRGRGALGATGIDLIDNWLAPTVSDAGSALASGAGAVASNPVGAQFQNTTQADVANAQAQNSGPNWGAVTGLLSGLFPKPPQRVIVQQGMSTTTKLALAGGGALLVVLLATRK